MLVCLSFTSIFPIIHIVISYKQLKHSPLAIILFNFTTTYYFFSFDKRSNLNCAGGALRDCDGHTFLHFMDRKDYSIHRKNKKIILDGEHIVYCPD